MKNLPLYFFIILIVFLFIGCPTTEEPTPTPTPNPNCSIIVTFPDSNLEAVIRETINKPAGDIYLCEVEVITYLYGYNRSITDLTGIENLTSLTELSLSINSISDISALSGLTSLTWLYLSSNSISDISALIANSGIDNVDYVDLRYNPLSDDSINIYIPQLEARGVTVAY